MTVRAAPVVTRLGVCAAFDGEDFVSGDVAVADGRVADVGLQPGVGDLVAAPGFVDLQLNGYAGVDFLSAGEEGYRHVASMLPATGVTAYQPTLISAPVAGLERALAAAGAAAGASEGARLLPAHLEGPFLSPTWPGAHPPAALLPPDPAIAERLLAAGPVGMVTLAPELRGGLELVEQLTDAGVCVSVGHSDATAEQARAAFDAGARALTHAFNAHRPLAARDPGPAGAALARDDVAVMVIADGVHLAPEIVALVHRAAGSRLVAVSDAMLAAGLGEGDYVFASVGVRVAGGRARLADGRLAGSVAPLDACLRGLVRCGVPLAEALAAVTSRPASLIGQAGLGRIVRGGPADIVLLDPGTLRPVRTFRDGQEVFAA